MPRKPDERINQAKEMFLKGNKLIEISKQLDLPEGTIRSWKNRYKWDCNVANEHKRNVAKTEKRKVLKRAAVNADVDSVMENDELTDRQRLFCLYYVRCFNATKAYQKAYGCSYETAAAIGYRLLAKVGVKEEIRRLKQNRLNRELLSEEDIFQKYMDIAFSDITDFLTFGQKEVPVMGPFGPIKIEDPVTGEKIELTQMVNTVSFRESGEVDGTLISEVKQGKDGASIKLADRMKALDWLADHMDLATAEQKAKIKKLEAESERIHRDTSPDDDEGVVIINDAPEDSADLGNHHSEVSEDIQQ